MTRTRVRITRISARSELTLYSEDLARLIQSAGFLIASVASQYLPANQRYVRALLANVKGPSIGHISSLLCGRTSTRTKDILN